MMLPNSSDRQATKVEFSFEEFPCCPCATEADAALRSLEGVFQLLIDPCDRRATVLFDPERVDIAGILSTLERFVTKPKVISVIMPMKGVL